MNPLVWLLPLGSAIWVGIDASKLGFARGRLGGGTLDMGVASYVLATLLIWIVGFPAYLIARGKYVEMQHRGGYPVGMAYGTAPAYGSPAGANPYGSPTYAAHNVPVPAAAPPQYSPDGTWWWNGQAWISVEPTPPVYGGETVLPS